MARKPQWVATVAGVAEPNPAGRVEVPLTIAEDPARPVVLRIPLTEVPRLLGQIKNAAERAETLRVWRRSERGPC